MSVLSDSEMRNNEAILANVEALGGGYVWDAEIFAVTLFDVPASDHDISALSQLRGVQQIALDASNLSFPVAESLLRIPALESLVLHKHVFSAQQIEALRGFGPEVQVVVA